MKPKILIVDDRPENLLALERILTDINVDFVRAESGNEALAKTLSTDFALVLMDVQMPDMDGFETVELLRQQEKTRYLPIIFVSAIYNEEIHLIRGVETGAVDFIVKPIVPQILIGKIKIILELHNQKQELETLAHERKKREQVFKLIAKELANGVEDQDVFESIVKTTADIFNTEHALVGRITQNKKVDTCVTFFNREIASFLSYDLKGTPCEVTTSDGICVFQDNVQERFPEDQDLVELGIKGYVGVSVKNSGGEPIGILTAFSSSPLQLPDYANEVLEILAGRIAVVLEQQEATQTNNLLKQRLKQAEKMEAIGTLAGGFAHDFNNILFPMLGFAELAKDSVKKDDPLFALLEKIMESALRAKDLVRQILTFSRQSGQKKKAFQIHTIITEALKLMRVTLPETIDIQQNIDPESGMINADPTQIHQVVMSLCTNAYHAMKEKGGVLTVSLNRTDEMLDTSVAQSMELKPGNYIKLEIGDTGIGMDKPTLDKIFDPYFTTKPHGEGSGLGLSVARGIIKRNKGAITVFSKLEKGTLFQVFLPSVSKSRVVPNQPSQSIIPTGKEHILFVDDEDSICEMISMMLGRLGYRVTSCLNPIDALEKLKENPDQFDLVMTDMTMPEMTGIDLTQEILKFKPDIPILLCTGFGESLDPETVINQGITDIVMKPISKKNLTELLRKILDESTNTESKN